MFGQSYSRVADQSEQEYLLERAKISLSYSSDFRSKLKEQKNQLEIPTKNNIDVVIDEQNCVGVGIGGDISTDVQKHVRSCRQRLMNRRNNLEADASLIIQLMCRQITGHLESHVFAGALRVLSRK